MAKSLYFFPDSFLPYKTKQNKTKQKKKTKQKTTTKKTKAGVEPGNNAVSQLYKYNVKFLKLQRKFRFCF